MINDPDLSLDDEEDWEDDEAYESILKTLPDGWTLIKINKYNYQQLLNLEDWLKDNCLKAFRKVNWGGYCSYSTGVMIECPYDATLCKIRWS